MAMNAVRLLLAAALASAPSAAHAEPAAPKGSLATTAPLGGGRVGMLLGGGVAVLLPYYEVAIGVGLSPRVDLWGRLESVVGLFHYPYLGVRWAIVDIGKWRLGVDGGVNYSFFGIATNQVNFTSTLYLTGELGISGPVTRNTDLVFAVNNEIDLLHYQRVEGVKTLQGAFHYDAAIFRIGMRTRLTEDLDGLLRFKLRVPVETFQYKAETFYVMPFLEIGGAWSW
jgi:hypothetical protein